MSPAGVTSGIDFGLTLVQKLRGTEYAQVTHLLSEYDPGRRWTLAPRQERPKEVVTITRDMFRDYNARVEQIAKTKQ